MSDGISQLENGLLTLFLAMVSELNEVFLSVFFIQNVVAGSKTGKQRCSLWNQLHSPPCCSAYFFTEADTDFIYWTIHTCESWPVWVQYHSAFIPQWWNIVIFCNHCTFYTVTVDPCLHFLSLVPSHFVEHHWCQALLCELQTNQAFSPVRLWTSSD